MIPLLAWMALWTTYPSRASQGPENDLTFVLPGTRFSVTMPSRKVLRDTESHGGWVGSDSSGFILVGDHERREVVIPAKPPSAPYALDGWDEFSWDCKPNWFLSFSRVRGSIDETLQGLFQQYPLYGEIKEGARSGFKTYTYSQIVVPGGPGRGGYGDPEGIARRFALVDDRAGVVLSLWASIMYPTVQECGPAYAQELSEFSAFTDSLRLVKPDAEPPPAGPTARPPKRGLSEQGSQAP